MAISKTSICNKALTLVGANPIVSIDDDSQNARILNRVYEIALKSILSECKWNFAIKRHTLVESTETIDWDYDDEAYVYVRPADVVRIFGTNDDDAVWREEGDLIISDTAALGIAYVYYMDVPSKYPASFVEAFADKLAAEIAYQVLNSGPIAERMLKKYEEISLPKARSENAQVGTHQYLKDDAWELARLSNDHPDA